jgi:hypothetical protein
VELVASSSRGLVREAVGARAGSGLIGGKADSTVFTLGGFEGNRVPNGLLISASVVCWGMAMLTELDTDLGGKGLTEFGAGGTGTTLGEITDRAGFDFECS